mmetsp:Transcript_27560/g.58578  ORF Transcript_27560/g.58578 Transcript_27560/m.58578 type:complete len:127 (-) Transcript_27560:33-413(-)
MKQMVHEIYISPKSFYKYYPTYVNLRLPAQPTNGNTHNYDTHDNDSPMVTGGIPYCQDCTSYPTFRGGKFQHRPRNDKQPNDTSKSKVYDHKHMSPNIIAKLAPLPFGRDGSLANPHRANKHVSFY